MQCPGCQREVLGWHFYCPDCRTQLRWTTGTLLTAYEIKKLELPAPPPPRKRSPILRAVAMSGITLAIIVTGVGISYQNANYHQGLTQNASLLSGAVATAEATLKQPVARQAASAKADQRLKEKAAPSLIPEQAQRNPQEPLVKPESSGSEVKLSAAPTTQSAAPKSAATEAVKSAEVRAEVLDAAFDPRLGLLTIKSETRARVYLNGQFSGVTPRTVRLLAGEYTVTLSADGCDDWSRKVQLQGRQQINIVAPLSKKAASAPTDSSR